MTRIGIKPEATRVALHRLRSDDWIASEKTGRTSQHRLTERGHKDSLAARHRIYGTPNQMAQGAKLVLTQSTDVSLDPVTFMQVEPRLFICAADTDLPKDTLHLEPSDIPHWLGSQFEPDALRNGYSKLHTTLLGINASLPAGTQLPEQDIAVLRVMIVHAWRRLTLRHPDLPRSAHSADWRGHDCRALVTTLLDRFPRPHPDALKAT